MPVDRAAVAHACRLVLAGVQDPRYAHTSSLHVRVAGRVVVDEQLRGPRAGDVFSVTKSVLSTVAGVVAAQGRLPRLDQPVADVLPELHGTPAQAHTWRHLLSMTRGAENEGPWDVDELTALPGGGGPPEGLPYGLLTWLDGSTLMAGGWAGQHLLALPSAAAVVVVTGDPGFVFGPPPSDQLPADWAPALDLVRRHLLTVLEQRDLPAR